MLCNFFVAQVVIAQYAFSSSPKTFLTRTDCDVVIFPQISVKLVLIVT